MFQISHIKIYNDIPMSSLYVIESKYSCIILTAYYICRDERRRFPLRVFHLTSTFCFQMPILLWIGSQYFNTFKYFPKKCAACIIETYLLAQFNQLELFYVRICIYVFMQRYKGVPCCYWRCSPAS